MLRPMPRSPVALLILLALLAASPAMADPAGAARVVDGNRLAFGDERVRLFGVDAPEARQRCETAEGRDWACGLYAARQLHDLVHDREVRCEPHGRDAHGETLAVCRAGGVDLGRALVRAGLAVTLPFVTKDYAADERDAREAKRGLWAGVFDTPASWRRKNPAAVLP
jgi:endonuclease YncB( thermonuclease family)